MSKIITENDFSKQVLNTNEPVMVDFFATWCGPCSSMLPIIDELSDELKGEAKIFKVDIDQSPSLADKYNIRSVPSFLIFKNGNLIDRITGVTEKQKLKDSLMALRSNV